MLREESQSPQRDPDSQTQQTRGHRPTPPSPTGLVYRKVELNTIAYTIQLYADL